jgi:hypothetical protein
VGSDRDRDLRMRRGQTPAGVYQNQHRSDVNKHDANGR